jgi:hypothetical protein
LAILALTIAAFDHFDRLFFAITPLTVGMITIITVPQVSAYHPKQQCA